MGSGNALFALSPSAIYWTGDEGGTWQEIQTRLDTGSLNDIDIDGDRIYLASRNGIAVSSGADPRADLGWTWAFNWRRDGCNTIDMQNSHTSACRGLPRR